MADFSLPSRFDVITCLFSSIGYVKTHERLQKALDCMARHLKPGGVLLVEPWFTSADWKPNTAHMTTVTLPDLKIARVNASLTEGNLAVMDMHHLVGTPEKTIHFVEHHELALFEIDEMLAAFDTAGLAAMLDPHGATGRGLYIATKSKENHDE